MAGVVERPLIIGTAGHVDHGKTALVRRLTGVDTDRLPEEKRRGISIELGFAPFVLPSGQRAAIVDVPGHERFVRQMLAGASGMDLVLLVVAADEGVMPQTREHLDILSLLGVRSGAVVLTKADLVESEWLELVAAEVREAVVGTFLEQAPFFPVSSVTGQGVDELVAYLEHEVRELPPRSAAGAARLPLDRVFTVAGFGTVVTGTLHRGRIRVEDRLELVPGGRVVRVRGLEVHGAPRQEAVAGERVAVNLAGVERHEVRRGAELIAPGSLVGTSTVYARLRLLPSAPALANDHRLMLHALTFAQPVQVITLEGDKLEPGQTGLVRLRLSEEAWLEAGDLFVLRRISPAITVAGGKVLATAGRYRRKVAEDLARLAALADERPEARLAALLAGKVVAPAGGWDLACAARLGFEPVQVGGYTFLLAEVRRRLAAFAQHLASERLSVGWPREILRQRHFPEVEPRPWAALLEELLRRGALAEQGGLVRPPGWQVALTPEEAQAVERFAAGLLDDPFQPPTQEEAEKTLGAPLVGYLLDAGVLVRVGAYVFHEKAIRWAEERLRAYFADHEELSMGAFRDLLGTSRRYAVPLLEYFDGARVTRRVRDVRVLAS